MKKYPNKIYVFRVLENTNEEYFRADEDVNAFAEVGERHRVGVYVLQETTDVTTDVNLEKTK